MSLMTKVLLINKEDNTINDILSILVMLIWVGWLTGFIIAKGFWSTLACVFPFYSCYLVVQKAMLVNGWI